MPPADKTLILFTRFPEAGTTKTRLIPALGAEGAARLQRQMTEQTLCQATALAQRHEITLEIHYHGGDPQAMAQWLGPHTFKRQGSGPLGERMKQAFAGALASANGPVVLIGSDCPELTTNILHQAFLELKTKDLVLGPAADGGYCLIGLRRPQPTLFDDIAWGTATVLQDTLARAHSLAVSQLTKLHDLDLPDDLAYFAYHPHPQ